MAEARVRAPSGPLPFCGDLQVKRDDQEKLSACSLGLLCNNPAERPVATASPRPLSRPILNESTPCSPAFVRFTSLRTLAGFPFPPRSRFVCTLYLGYHPDRRRCIASEHRTWPISTSFRPLHIYVAPQHLVLTSIRWAGPTGRFRRRETGAMQRPAFRLRRIRLSTHSGE